MKKFSCALAFLFCAAVPLVAFADSATEKCSSLRGELQYTREAAAEMRPEYDSSCGPTAHDLDCLGLRQLLEATQARVTAIEEQMKQLGC